MSYYRPSFSQTVAMTRGRGFSSSYRGGSGGRSSWGGSGDRGGRGGYGSSRGGRFSSSFSSPLDSRSKYPQSSSDRYSGGSSRDYDDYHHKPYRPDMSGGYGGRDHRSPDRKRLRGPEAPSSRRSHEGDSFNSSSSRYQSNSFPDHRSFIRDRRPSFSSRREDFRKPSGPPPSASPRGGYRGRISTRGVRGIRLRDGPPRRRLVESSYAIRRRLPSRIQPDYSRRLKISRLRSAIARRTAIRRHRDSEEKEKDSEEEEEEEPKKIKEKPASAANETVEETKEKESPKKSPKKEVVSDKEEKEGESDEKSRRREFIKLVCPHCNSKCITFSKYSMHLHSSRHMTAMRHVAMKQKSVLARMRLSQRNAQRELEKTADDLVSRTNFCPLCKLNYKQPKATHQACDSHKNMKKFLMPYCRVCRITFKSPMLYETHICSIEHIKRKSRSDVNGEKSEKEEVSANEDDNLESFMTIDSVGDVDDEEESKKKEIESGKPKEPINVGIEQIRKVEVHYCELCRMYLQRVEENEIEKMLVKHCKLRTHMQRYIIYKEDRELAHRAERLQRKETAEKEREKNKVKEGQKTTPQSQDKKSEQGKSGDDKEKASFGDEEIVEDKLWADDVNKDLGDLLAEAESGNKSSDEDEEDSHADGERYDSEKNGEEKKDEEKEAVVVAEVSKAGGGEEEKSENK